ncbi:hypothetical protein BLA6860_03280 [Burkholderia lata]|nr:hypothetical protein BLA6860_03280 [Burkholderia lata]
MRRTAGSDCIFTQADATITSAPAVFKRFTSFSNCNGFRLPTSRLPGVSNQIASTTSMPSSSMYWTTRLVSRFTYGAISAMRRAPSVFSSSKSAGRRHYRDQVMIGSRDLCQSTFGHAVIAEAHGHDCDEARRAHHVHARVGEFGGTAQGSPLHRGQFLLCDLVHTHAARMEGEALSRTDRLASAKHRRNLGIHRRAGTGHDLSVAEMSGQGMVLFVRCGGSAAGGDVAWRWFKRFCPTRQVAGSPEGESCE